MQEINTSNTLHIELQSAKDALKVLRARRRIILGRWKKAVHIGLQPALARSLSTAGYAIACVSNLIKAAAALEEASTDALCSPSMSMAEAIGIHKAAEGAAALAREHGWLLVEKIK